jgi:hypothetical protein
MVYLKELIKRLYRTPPEEMWYPRDEQLLKLGIATKILDN